MLPLARLLMLQEATCYMLQCYLNGVIKIMFGFLEKTEMPRPPDLAGNEKSCLSFSVVDSPIIKGSRSF